MQDGKHFRLARHPVMAQKLHDHLGKITPVDLLCKLRRVTLLSIPQCLHNKRTYNVNYVIICTGIIKHIHIVIKTTPEAISILISYLCHIVCKACSVTTITVCTLIHNNNIMYNNIDCKVSSTTRLAYREWSWTMISGMSKIRCTVPLVKPPAIDDFKNYADDVWFCFRYNVFMSYPHALKIV